MDIIYFDNSATTRPAKEAVDAAARFMTEEYGNPSSLHIMGINAAAQLTASRKMLATLMGCDAGEVYFTSGGTESNNTALFGAVRKNRHVGKKIVVSAYEHDSMLAALKTLEAEGYAVEYVSPEKNGRISPEKFGRYCDENTAFVSCMLVNNEIGAINDVAEIFKAARAKSPSVICHTDAVQGFGKISCNPKALCCDMMSVSGHKLHAPKGIGALYIKKGLNIPARNIGGGQESKMRSGTEAMPNIAAFAAAAELCKKSQEHLKYVKALCERLRKGLTDAGIIINSPPDALPYILNITVRGVRSEVLLNFLSSKGICVSAGSACSKGKRSHVLTALGLSPADIDSSLRISLSRYNTAEEADILIKSLIEAKELLTIKR